MSANNGWKRVSAQQPCPVCGKPDNCSISADGGAVWCGRIAEGAVRANAGGQWLHKLNGDPSAPAARAGEDSPRETDWSAKAADLAQSAAAKRRELADALGVSGEALEALNVGWGNIGGECWTFPERDGTAQTIGINRRFPNGDKKSVGKRGLTFAPNWRDTPGPVLIVEGGSDVAAGMTMGLCVVGRPSNSGGAKHLADLLRDLPPEREIIVLGENDRKPDGKWPGKDGAIGVVGQLADRLGRSIGWALPPEGAKDLREWLAKHGVEGGEFLARLQIQSAASTWPEIVPFDALDLPEFPTCALPSALREWVQAESHATQTPADLAALLALAVCSATMARRVTVEPRPGWKEPVNLYVTVLLDPGNRKSAVFADATGPLREIEAELIEAARPAVARAQSERRQSEARLKKCEKQAAEKGDAEARQEAGELAEMLAGQPEPVLPRLVVDDATAEKIGMILEDQGGRIASMAPEGGVFDLMAGMYSKSGTPQFGIYLIGHSGEDLITDRVSRKSVRVPRIAITCAYAMQPAVIRGLAGNPAFRSRGLLGRFLYAAPRSWIGHRQVATAPVPDTIKEVYRRTIAALWQDGEGGEKVLRLSAAAANEFEEWEREIEAMLAEGGRLEQLRDWGGKLAGATLRLAAVLHCVERTPDELMVRDAVAAAVEIARYLIPHADAVLGMMQAGDAAALDDDSRYILKWIKRHGRREFTKSEAQQHGKRRFPRADDIDPALDELARRNYIRPWEREPAGAGRPPSPTFDVHPAVFGKTAERSGYSGNSMAPHSRDGFQNIQSASPDPEKQNRVEVTI